VDYIIHLAGAGVADKRWTDERKKVLASSRIDSAALILDRLKIQEKKSRLSFLHLPSAFMDLIPEASCKLKKERSWVMIFWQC
jgi:hypothetical protein